MSDEFHACLSVTHADKEVFATFPQPIAIAWRRVFSVTGTSDRFRQIFNFSETLARDLAASLLADLVRGPANEEVALAVEAALEKKSLGQWWDLVRLLIKTLRERPSSFFVEAGPWYYARGNKPSEAAQLVTRLIVLRNKQSHSSPLVDECEEIAGLADALAVCRGLLDSLGWFANYRVFDAIPGATGLDGRIHGEVRRYVGESGPVVEEASWTAPLNRGCPYIQHPTSAGGVLDASPWMAIAADGSRNRIALLQKVAKDRLLAAFDEESAPAKLHGPDGKMQEAPWTRALLCDRPTHAPNSVTGALAFDVPRPAPASSRFELLEEIGRGGFARVWRARDRHTGAIVAMKVFSGFVPAPLLVRIREEARIMQEFVHPKLLTGTLREEDGRIMIEMRLMRGSLKDKVRPPGCAPSEVLALGRDLLEALSFLHAKGKIHCDVKPSNLPLDESGNVYLADFGVAEDSRDDFGGRLGQIAGTPEYMAPEQREGRLEPRSDLYALARVLHDLKKGRVCADERPGTGIEGDLGRVLVWIGNQDPRKRPTAEQALSVLQVKARSEATPLADNGTSRTSRESLALQLRGAIERGGILDPNLRDRLASLKTDQGTAADVWDSLRIRHVRSHWARLRGEVTILDLLESGAGFTFSEVRRRLSALPLEEEQQRQLAECRDLRCASVTEALPAKVLPLEDLVDCLRQRESGPLDEASLWRSCLAALGDPFLSEDGSAPPEALFGRLVVIVGSLEHRRVGLPKPGGGKRWLQIPPQPLARVQSAIARRLSMHGQVSSHAVAFARGRSPMLHALYHAGAEGAVVVDIHDYFGSIWGPQVERALARFGGCYGWTSESLERLLVLLTVTHRTRSNRFLPQGAPSSPLIANLVGSMLDKFILQGLAGEQRMTTWRYSRYADDLVLSSPRGGHHFHEEAESLLRVAVRKFGWTPSPKKTRHWSSLRGGPLSLCGVTVAPGPHEGPGLPREVRRTARAALHAALAGTLTPSSAGLLAYVYSVTGKHGYIAALPGRTRSAVLALGRALSPSAHEFLTDWASFGAAKDEKN